MKHGHGKERRASLVGPSVLLLTRGKWNTVLVRVCAAALQITRGRAFGIRCCPRVSKSCKTCGDYGSEAVRTRERAREKRRSQTWTGQEGSLVNKVNKPGAARSRMVLKSGLWHDCTLVMWNNGSSPSPTRCLRVYTMYTM